MKLVEIYGIDPLNKYMTTFSHFKALNYFEFVNKVNENNLTLIVGLDNLKKLKYNSDKLPNNIHFIYSPEEYLSEFIKGFELFFKLLDEIIYESLNYEILDMYFTRIITKQDIFNITSKYSIDNIYVRGKIAYLYSKTNNTVYIINFYDYIDNKIITNEEYASFFLNTKTYKDNDNKIFNYYSDIFPNQDRFFLEKLIPYFLYQTKT